MATAKTPKKKPTGRPRNNAPGKAEMTGFILDIQTKRKLQKLAADRGIDLSKLLVLIVKQFLGETTAEPVSPDAPAATGDGEE